MNKLTYLLFLCCPVFLFGQFGNEWIDYDKTHYKIYVEEDQLHRISFEDLQQAGLPTNAVGFKLMTAGQEVPIYITTDGQMQAGDFIEFVGKKNDGKFDTQLFDHPDDQVTDAISLFDLDRAYYLTWDASETHLRYESTSNFIGANPPAAASYFWYNYEYIANNTFFEGAPDTRELAGVNSYLSNFGVSEGWVGSKVGPGLEAAYQLQTTEPYVFAGAEANFEVKVVGRSDDFYIASGDHHVQIRLNGELYIDDIYNGFDTRVYEFTVPLSEMGNSNEFKLRSVGDIWNENFTNASIDANSLAYINVHYPRGFDLNGLKQIEFEIPNDGDKLLQFENFDGGLNSVLYDLTNNLRILPVIENGEYKILLDEVPGGPATRILYLSNGSSTSAVEFVSDLTSVDFVDYSDPANSGDFILLTSSVLMENDSEENANQIELYANYRSTELGGGYQPLIVDVAQLYDQFAQGVRQHPLAIQRFVNYIEAQHTNGNWTVNPEFLYLVGKSHRYGFNTYNPTNFEENLVPTYGSSGSDIMLAAPNKDVWKNQMSVGRLSARSPDDVREYLEKVIAYEALSENVSCEPSERKWLKELIHIASGNNDGEASSFANYLNNYEAIVEDSLFGGEVVLELSSETGDIIPAPVDGFINNGIAVITFVGHSNGEFWSYDLGAPDDYDNEGKYPYIISSSCFVGDVHQPFEEESRIMAEIWTTFPERGCIAFLASVKFGFPQKLDIYTDRLYRNFSKQYYGEPMGYVIRKTIEDIYNPDDIGVHITCQEFTLSGDPAISLYHFERPEYVIEDQDVLISPQVVTAAVDSITLDVTVHNYGLSAFDTITLAVEQRYPNGSAEIVASARILAPINNASYQVKIANQGEDQLGSNSLTVYVDYDAETEEDCEDNNSVVRDFQILPTTALPIDPCDFSIVSSQDVTLRASTASPIVSRENYIFQIDTTNQFNSPLLTSFQTESIGGVIEWSPSITYLNNTVYYWRIALDQNSTDFTWRGSSFVYVNGSADGFNQSHFEQFVQNDFVEMEYNEDTRLLEYGGYNNALRVKNGHTGLSTISGGEIQWFLNGLSQASNSCMNSPESWGCAGGMVFAVFEPDTILVPWKSYQQPYDIVPTTVCELVGQYGNIHCGSDQIKESFQFPTNTEEQYTNLINFINDIPDGHYVLSYSINNHHMEMDQVLISLQEEVYDFYEGMGINGITGLSNNLPFITFGRKGDPTYGNIYEEIATTSDEILEVDIEVKDAFGSMSSVIVGPANSWSQLQWSTQSFDPNDGDFATVDILGIRFDGQMDFLFNTDIEQEVDISNIDAATYPKLQLVLRTEDHNFATPPQPVFWRVYFDRFTELSLNENSGFAFCCDTLNFGQSGSFEMSVMNASNILSDSISVSYSIIDQNNIEHPIDYPIQSPLFPGESFTTQTDFSTFGFEGANTFHVQLNPEGAQNEKYSFNNELFLPFYVNGDEINPYLDVTFDGQHILSGDIVSPEPTIAIKIKDDNPFLPLNDTMIAEISLVFPDGTQREISYAEDNLVLVGPEDVSVSNEATITFNPLLEQDGRYQLVVKGRDMSGNLAAVQDYIVAFEIIRESMISNVINYPNPFSTSTQFIFTLTGTSVPDNLKIQIMTISGKVVREITREELGDLKIGRNRTDYKWDGSDQFGNELANGVYFYRVVARNETGDLDLFTNAEGKYNMSSTSKMDELFTKHGIGKMYKMR